MVQNNKVLTVSYGTFSCTLEGFEDSFDTMKAIAEYFRDLAADDRYFGAEPPQPDADMLARIAQREISRQVEARTDSKGIVLRAAEAAPAAAPVAAPVVEPVVEAEPAPVEAPAEAPAAEVAPDTQPAEAQSPAPQDDTPAADAEVDETPVDAVAEEVIEKTTEEATAEPPVEEPSVEEAPVEALTEDAADEADAEALDAEEADIAPEAIEETSAEDEAPAAEEVGAIADIEVDEAEIEEPAAEVAEVDDAADDDDIAQDTAEEAALAAIAARVSEPEEAAPVIEAEPVEKDDTVPAADSIAAKLQRIRAVVSRNEKAAQSETYAEDEHAEDVVTAAAAGLTTALDTEEDEIEDEADDVASILEKLDAQDDADAEEALQDDALFSDLDEAEADEAEDDLDNILGSDDAGEKPAQPTARVIKVKRRDVEAAIAAGELQAAEEAETQEDEATGSSLLPEDEADLMRELAAVEAELKAQSDEDEDEQQQDTFDAEDVSSDLDDEFDDTAVDSDVRDDATMLEADEDDLSRLMATADEKLDDPDTSSSREAYTHLRAAVAAAQAERSAGGTVGTHTSDDDYREDLASVVRPRRPTVKASSPRPRAGGDRPAPLKLVAEQRIDVPTETQNRGPVRPRRVASVVTEESNSESGNGFAEYAAEKGAVTLPDLLEAAAAYMSFVEGREQFSRPQLMNKVRQLDNQSFNREDGLRSFGQLLRDGKIEKAGGGRFVASGDIGFHPNNRAAG